MQSNKTKWLKKWFECLIWWNIFKARDKFFWYGKLASTNVKRIYGIGQRRNAESVEQIKVANFLQFHHSGQESSQKEYFFGICSICTYLVIANVQLSLDNDFFCMIIHGGKCARFLASINHMVFGKRFLLVKLYCQKTILKIN